MGTWAIRPASRWLLLASVLRVPFTLTHSIEDFSVGIHQRFGLPLLLGAFLLSLGYAAQLAGGMLSARGARWGHVLNLAVALVWLAGAMLDHLDEVIGTPTGAYRAGLVSKLLEVGIMLVSAAWVGLALVALRRPGARSSVGSPRRRGCLSAYGAAGKRPGGRIVMWLVRPDNRRLCERMKRREGHTTPSWGPSRRGRRCQSTSRARSRWSAAAAIAPRWPVACLQRRGHTGFSNVVGGRGAWREVGLPIVAE